MPPGPPLPHWSSDLTFKFLEFYASESLIWDPKHPDHKNREANTEAWERICSAMGSLTGGKHTVTDLKRKKESLMTTYRMLKRRKKHNPKFSPGWFCFNAIDDFLSDIYLADGDESTDKQESESNESPYLNKRYLKSSLRRSYPRYKSTTSTPPRVQIKREVSSPPAYTTTTSINEIDECELYGQLLAKKLKRLDQHQRDIAMHEIDNIMFRAKLNYESREQARMNTNSPVFVDPLDKQNDEYEAEYLEDNMQE